MSLRGAKSLRRKVARMRRNLSDDVNDAVERNADVTAHEARRRVSTHNTTWTGNLYRSIGTEKNRMGRLTRHRIVADVPYAAYVEFGTGARGENDVPLRFQFQAPSHTPNLTEEITEWVMEKPLFFGPRTEGIAWAIAKAIGRYGTYAHPYMRPAWFRTKPALINDAERAASRVVSNVTSM